MNKLKYLVAFLVLALTGLGIQYYHEWEFILGTVMLAMMILLGNGGMQYVFIGLILLAGIVLYFGNQVTVPLFLTVTLPGAAMGLSIVKESGYGRIVFWGFTASVLAVSLIWLTHLSVGKSLAMHTVEYGVNNYFEWFKQSIHNMGLSQAYADMGLTEEVINQIKLGLMRGLERVRPSLYIMESWLQIMLALGLARIILRRGYQQVKPFEDRLMPWQLDWLVIFGLVLWLIGNEWNYAAFETVGANILFIMVPVTFYFGLSLAVYVYRRLKPKIWWMLAIITAVLFFPTYLFIFIVIIGLFDPLIDYRSIERKRRSRG